MNMNKQDKSIFHVFFSYEELRERKTDPICFPLLNFLFLGYIRYHYHRDLSFIRISVHVYTRTKRLS